MEIGFRFPTFFSLDLKTVMSYDIQNMKLVKVETGTPLGAVHWMLLPIHDPYLSVPACTNEGILLCGHSYLRVTWYGLDSLGFEP